LPARSSFSTPVGASPAPQRRTLAGPDHRNHPDQERALHEQLRAYRALRRTRSVDVVTPGG
jgi:hypothetical protein